jgi:ferredoxin
MSYTARIDARACAAHGDCEDLAPEIFLLDGDVATIIGDGPDDLLLEAARICPSVAITVLDAGGRQVYP